MARTSAAGLVADQNQGLARFGSPNINPAPAGGAPSDLQRIQGWLAQSQQDHNEARARQAQDFAGSTAVENNIAARNAAEENARRFRQEATSLRNVPGGKTARMFNEAYIAERQKFDSLRNQNPGAEFARTPEQESALAHVGLQGHVLQQEADARTLSATADAERALSGPQESFGNPVDELDANGKPIRAQYGDRGSRRTIDGAQPVPKANGGISIGPDGQLQVTGGSNGPKLTEQQSKDLGFYTRGNEALKNLGTGDALTSYGSTLASHVPGLGNKLAGDDYQRAQQAGNEFIASLLRKDSGAAITRQEQETYGRMYLPQPGDSPDTLKQKAGARQTALDAIKRGMGPAQQLAPQDNPTEQSTPQLWRSDEVKKKKQAASRRLTMDEWEAESQRLRDYSHLWGN